MIFEKFREAIAEIFTIDEASVTLDLSFVDDLNADSLDFFELVAFMEDEFDVPTPDDDQIAGIVTVGDAVEYIRRFVEE